MLLATFVACFAYVPVAESNCVLIHDSSNDDATSTQLHVPPLSMSVGRCSLTACLHQAWRVWCHVTLQVVRLEASLHVMFFFTTFRHLSFSASHGPP